MRFIWWVYHTSTCFDSETVKRGRRKETQQYILMNTQEELVSVWCWLFDGKCHFMCLTESDVVGRHLFDGMCHAAEFSHWI